MILTGPRSALAGVGVLGILMVLVIWFLFLGAGVASAQEEEPTTTEPEVTTTFESEPTTTLPPEVDPPTTLPSLVECFRAGQDRLDPPLDQPDCATAWSSGRMTTEHLDDQARRDDLYRTPFLVAAGLVVFMFSARLVGSWRR